MAKIEVIGPEPYKDEQGRKNYSAMGTRVLIDGRELPEVRSVELRFAVGEIVAAKMELNATDQFHFEGDASVQATIVAYPGYTLSQHTFPDGTKVYRAQKDAE
jgi:hypothetical protein